MKKTVIRFACLLLLLAITVGTILAEEGEAVEATSDGVGPGAMIGVLFLGGAAIVGVGMMMMSQQSAENDSE